MIYWVVVWEKCRWHHEGPMFTSREEAYAYANKIPAAARVLESRNLPRVLDVPHQFSPAELKRLEDYRGAIQHGLYSELERSVR